MTNSLRDETLAVSRGRASDRRTLLRGLAVGAAGSAVVASISTAGAQAVAPPTGVNDINIQRFALNFEYLGAELYRRALGMPDLPDDMVVGGTRAPAGVFGVRTVNFTSPVVRAYVQQLASDETLHVQFVRNNLGANVVSRPTIEFQTAFATVAASAGLGKNFDAFANDVNFLLAAYVIEDVCVSALHGAVTLIQSKKVLDGATGLLGAEAYQAGMIRSALFNLGYADQTNAISYLRTRLDGEVGTPSQGNDHGVGTLSRASIANVDSQQAIVDERSMTQILQIAYGSSANPPVPGGFFPYGINMS